MRRRINRRVDIVHMRIDITQLKAALISPTENFTDRHHGDPGRRPDLRKGEK